MKNKKIFFAIIVGISGLLCGDVRAQEAAQPENASDFNLSVKVIAWVNIDEARIKEVFGNQVKIHAKISNQKGNQSGVKYSIQLIKKEAEGREWTIDETVFWEQLFIGEYTSLEKVIIYQAPEYLNGSFDILLKLKNETGMPLSTINVGKVDLKGNGKAVIIEEDNCHLELENQERYTLVQGVDLKKEEKLYLVCKTSNLTGEDVSVKARLKYYSGTVFGPEFSDGGTDAADEAMFDYKTNEQREIRLEIPKPEKPGAYDFNFSLTKEEKNISNKIKGHFVVVGESASIKNVVSEKNYYAKGDQYGFDVFWAGSADSFLGARFGSGQAEEKYFLVLRAENSVGKKCFADVEKAVSSAGESPTRLEGPVLENCANFNIKASILNSKKELLFEADYFVSSQEGAEGGTKPEKETNTTKNILFMIIFLPILIFAVFYFFKRIKKNSLPPLLFFGFVFLSSLLFANNAKGVTLEIDLSGTGYTSDTASADVNLSPSSVTAGGNITITASGGANMKCDNGIFYTVNGTVNSVSKNIIDRKLAYPTNHTCNKDSDCNKHCSGGCKPSCGGGYCYNIYEYVVVPAASQSYVVQSSAGSYSAHVCLTYTHGSYSDTACADLPYTVTSPDPVCGNGDPEGTEQCDNGGSNGVCPALCSTNCLNNTCPPATASCTVSFNPLEVTAPGSSTMEWSGSNAEWMWATCSGPIPLYPSAVGVSGNHRFDFTSAGPEICTFTPYNIHGTAGDSCDATVIVSSLKDCNEACSLPSECETNHCAGSGFCRNSSCELETDCTCASGPVCGNGIPEGTEQCDNGGSNGVCPATCSVSCTNNSCGTVPVCGNGIPEGTEQCDNGGSNGVCPASCSVFCTNNSCGTVPVCGNGIPEGTEQCDNGGSNGVCPATCSVSCTNNSCGTVPVCGNGIPEGTEQCDNGASNGVCPATCSVSCTNNSCCSAFCWMPPTCTPGSCGDIENDCQPMCYSTDCDAHTTYCDGRTYCGPCSDGNWEEREPF